MDERSIERPFQRHPRPQLPTKAALLEKSRKAVEQHAGKYATDLAKELIVPVAKIMHSAPLPKQALELAIKQESPWSTLSRLGNLKQGSQIWSICSLKGQLTMVKKVTVDAGQREIEKMKLLEHPNIAYVKDAFHLDSSIYLRYEYSRYTLQEILSVHLLLEESHVRVIATSIFAAIKHMAAAGIVHTSISLASVRISNNGGVIVLSNFEDCTWQTAELDPNADLEQLGYLILECMNGSTCKDLRDPLFVREQRESNKIFGLEDGERWSGHKLLVDFLEDLFNTDKPSITKLDRPHQYVMRPPNYEILVPFIELVPLECFTLWRPAAARTIDSSR